MENLSLTQDFTRLQSENEKTVSGLLPVQFVSPQFVCIVVLQHKDAWMSFLAELISWLNGERWTTMQRVKSYAVAVYVGKQLAAMWQKCIERT